VGDFLGDLFNEGGVLDSGPSPRPFGILGNYTQARDGRLALSLGGDTPGVGSGHHSLLSVFGDLEFAPQTTISVLPFEQYTPTIGAELVVLAWEGLRLGRALVKTDPWFAEQGVIFRAEWTADSLVLTAKAFAPGDFNGDGVLNGLDIPGFKSALADTLGWQTATGLDADLLGDFNGDGVLNGLDIPGFKSALAGGNTPEPGTLVLAAMGLLTVLRRRRRSNPLSS